MILPTSVSQLAQATVSGYCCSVANTVQRNQKDARPLPAASEKRFGTSGFLISHEALTDCWRLTCTSGSLAGKLRGNDFLLNLAALSAHTSSGGEDLRSSHCLKSISVKPNSNKRDSWNSFQSLNLRRKYLIFPDQMQLNIEARTRFRVLFVHRVGLRPVSCSGKSS